MIGIIVCVAAVMAALFIVSSVHSPRFPEIRTTCVDCYSLTPGGRRCWTCASNHADVITRYGEFCRVWTRIGVAAYRQSLGVATHPTGVYR